MRAPQPPKFALVSWPDNRYGAPSCIYLSGVADAVRRGAIVVAVEDDELCPMPVQRRQGDGDPGNDDGA